MCEMFSILACFQAVLLYVREPFETVYTALMLDIPTLNGLLRAVRGRSNLTLHLVKKGKKGGGGWLLYEKCKKNCVCVCGGG